MLIEHTLFETIDKVNLSIKRLKTFEPEEGYYLAFSGGKDSIVIYELAKMAGVKFDAHYSCTGIDPPELVKFIREFYPDVKWHYPKRGFFREIIKRGVPLRQQRWCCAYLKEDGGVGRKVVTGIRWAESIARSKRRMTETCMKDGSKTYIHPIIDWSNEEVWEFIKKYNFPYCSLYDEGWKRIGCLLCPMAGKMRKIGADRYPRYKRAYLLAFKKLYNRYIDENVEMKRGWKSGEEMFDWWLNENKNKKRPGQMVIFE